MMRIIGALVILGLLLGLPLGVRSDSGKREKDNQDKCSAGEKLAGYEQKYQKVFTEIMLLNLINGLNLTEEQIKEIIDCHKELELLKEEGLKEYETLAEEVFKAYDELKKVLEKNQGIPKEVESRAYRMERQVKELKEKMRKGATEIAKKVEEILSEAQREIVNTFKPCLIPPKNLKDPVRAGQATDNNMVIDLLQRLRDLPDEVFERKKDKIVTRHLEKMQQHIGNLTEEEYNKEKQYLLKLIEKVRAMDDVEFELEAPDLATEYMKREKKLKGEDLRDELDRLHKIRRGGFGRVGIYLLNPAIVPILQKRLEAMKNTPPPEPADLDKIKRPAKRGQK